MAARPAERTLNMTEAICEQILQAVHECLDGIELDGLLVERNRDTEVQEYPSLIMIDGRQTPIESALAGSILYDLEVEIEGHVALAEGEGDVNIGTKLNELYALVMQALREDHTFGDLATNLTEGEMLRDIARSAGHSPTAAFSLMVTIQFETQDQDPTQQ